MRAIGNLLALGVLIGIGLGIPLAVYLALDAILYGIKVILWFVAGVGLLVLAYFAAMNYYRERNQANRVIDGSLPIQRHRLPTGDWLYVDMNKLPGAAYVVGPSVGYKEIPSSVNEQMQLLINQGVQDTRSLAAISPGDEALIRTNGTIQQPRLPANITKMLFQPPKPAIAPAQLPPPPAAPMAPLLTLTDALGNSTGNRWIVGQSDNGDAVAFEPSSHAHAAIVGATGTGKTTSVGFSLALAALRAGWHVAILDPDGGANWQPFAAHAEWHETDRSAFPGQIEAIHNMYERRENTGNPRPVLIVLEEYGDLIRQLRTASRTDADAVDGMLDSILQRGRKRRIHVAMIDQYPEHWSQAIIGGTKFRAVFQMGPNQGAKMEEYKAARLPDVGRFLVRGVEYSSFDASAQVHAILRQLPAPSSAKRIINGTINRSPARSFARSVTVLSPVDTPPATPPNALPADRSEETRLAILAHLDANPTATQADVRNALNTSKGYTHQVWHEWHTARSARPALQSNVFGKALTVLDATNPADAADIKSIQNEIANGNFTVKGK